MGMTLWIHTLEGRTFSKESDDHSLMCSESENLDRACERLKVAKLSSFFDTTDLDYNMAEGAGEEEDPEMDPETGWPYGIDAMKWFDAALGLSALTALRTHVASTPTLDPKKNPRLLAELDDCIAKLTGPAKNGGKFHLAMIL